MAKIIPFNSFTVTAEDFRCLDHKEYPKKYASYYAYIDAISQLPHEKFWAVMVRDRPDKIGEMVAEEVEPFNLTMGIVMAQKTGNIKAAYQLMEHLERFIKTGQNQSLGAYAPELRGYVYPGVDCVNFALINSYY